MDEAKILDEARILKISFKDAVDHKEQWQNLKVTHDGLSKILDVINQPEHALIFGHDDPDGITSGLIFKRMLEKKGWKATLLNPEGFLLQPHQFDKGLFDNPKTTSVFILDKGTLEPYSIFGERLPVYIIDHHPSPKIPENCVYFNPCLPIHTLCSASILAHGISTLAGTRDEYDDFLCLIGLKGDWAIEPVDGTVADFVKPFFVKYGKQFSNLLKIVKERPTMFDSSRRDVTSLLSRIAEFVHATGGGGFSYFYNNRNESLKDIDHPRCITNALEALGSMTNEIKTIETLDAFVDLIPEKERVHLIEIFNYYLDDWESANTMLDSSVKTMMLGDNGVYIFVGGKVPLLPMIGTIKLYDLKKKAGDKNALMIMVSSVASDFKQVSVRGSGDMLHSGKFCAELQDSLHVIYPDLKDKISGGGHPRAAGFTVKTDKVPFVTILAKATQILNEMLQIDAKYQNNSLSVIDKGRSVKLGLEYMK